MKIITENDYKDILIQKKSVIDVRAPIEFEQGTVPAAINLPILNDSERELIGTVYKQQGSEAAVKLGYEIVSGENRTAKVHAWAKAIKNNPDILVMCFRGGQRSQISQKWILDAGFDISRFEKGYKHFRQWILDQYLNYSNTQSMRILSGTTGSGKTKLIKQLMNQYPVVDLEGLANHKGSAFGKEMTEQPSQADFENRLVQDILIQNNKFTDKYILFEDESRMIGKRQLSEAFFLKLRESKVILMKISIEKRIDNIFDDYVTLTHIKNGTPEQALVQFQKYIDNTNQISKRLGGLRAQEIIADLEACKKDYLESIGLEKNKIWIEKLLVWYYDPLYLKSLDIRKPAIEFEGSEKEITNYLLA
jgi:tRNA 2-selenouridine synthase